MEAPERQKVRVTPPAPLPCTESVSRPRCRFLSLATRRNSSARPRAGGPRTRSLLGHDGVLGPPLQTPRDSRPGEGVPPLPFTVYVRIHKRVLNNVSANSTNFGSHQCNPIYSI